MYVHSYIKASPVGEEVPVGQVIGCKMIEFGKYSQPTDLVVWAQVSVRRILFVLTPRWNSGKRGKMEHVILSLGAKQAHT